MQFRWRKAAAKKTDAKNQLQTPAKLPERQIRHARAEIHAYIVIRDRLLAEAEQLPTNATLHRACIANDVVEIFLKPARTPYEVQYLPEDEVNRESERCEAVKIRIEELRGKIVTPSAGTTVPKNGRTSLFGVRAIGTTPA